MIQGPLVYILATAWQSQQLEHRDFPFSDLEPNIHPFPIKKQAKTFQVGVYHSEIFSSTIWRKFHENPNKNSKVTNA